MSTQCPARSWHFLDRSNDQPVTTDCDIASWLDRKLLEPECACPKWPLRRRKRVLEMTVRPAYGHTEHSIGLSATPIGHPSHPRWQYSRNQSSLRHVNQKWSVLPLATCWTLVRALSFQSAGSNRQRTPLTHQRTSVLDPADGASGNSKWFHRRRRSPLR